MGGAFIVLEGTTGVGKTTMAEHLAAELGATVLRYPTAFLRFREEVRLDETVEPVARLGYYLAAAVELSGEVRRIRRAGGPVLCDRYVVSPLAVLEAERALSPQAIDRFAAPFLEEVERPDVTILLTAPYQLVLARVREREGGGRALGPIHERALASEEAFSRWQSAIAARASTIGPVETVDTNGRSVEEVRTAASAVVHARAARAPD